MPATMCSNGLAGGGQCDAPPPMNDASVTQALQAAASQDPARLKQAECVLKLWQSSPGFYTVLAQLCCYCQADAPGDQSGAATVRWMAVVYFKNAADVCWRRHPPTAEPPPHAVPQADRAVIRERLLHALLNEPTPAVAVQLAVLVAKLARGDCPRHWPQLVPTLTAAVISGGGGGDGGDGVSIQLSCQRALLGLHHVTRALASKRLMSDRRVFYELTDALLPIALAAWQRFSHALPAMCASATSTMTATAVGCARLSLKIVRRLVVYGARCPSHADTLVEPLIGTVLERCRHALIARHQLLTTSSAPAVEGDAQCSRAVLVEALSKYAGVHFKLLLDVIDQHAFSLVASVGDCLAFGCQLLFSAEGQALLFNRVTVLCLAVLRCILLCPQYRSGVGNEASPQLEATPPPSPVQQRAQQVRRVIGDFFGSQPLDHILNELVQRYIPLTADDLQAWTDDPEAFYCSDDSAGRSTSSSCLPAAAEGQSLAPHVECLFIALFRLYKGRMTPLLLDMMRRTFDDNSNADETQLAAILARDALYTAVGWAAFDLYDDVDFDGWLRGGLLRELATHTPPQYGIVRRRVLWLIGRWVGVKIAPAMRAPVYAAIAQLLDAEREDLVVRLTAAQTLRDAVDDFEFGIDEFVPYLSEIFARLFQLLVEVSECDTKLRVLNIVSCVVERLDAAIRPHCDALLAYLPQLWRSAASDTSSSCVAGADMGMLCAVIVTTLTHLVEALGEATQALCPLVLDVLVVSTDVQQPQHVYLLDDALQLWRTVVERTACLHPDLLQLFNRLPSLMELGSENFESGAAICRAYILLAPQHVVSVYGCQLDTVCCQFVQAESVDNSQGGGSGGRDLVRPESAQVALRLLDTALCAAGGEATLAHFPSLALWTLRTLLPSGGDSSNHGVGDVSSSSRHRHLPVVMATLLSVLARVVLLAPSIFEQLLVAAAADGGADVVLAQLLDVWLASMPMIWQAERRKLCALALCHLLPECRNSVFSHFNCLLLNVAETLNDIAPVSSTSTVSTTPCSMVETDVLVMSEADVLSGGGEGEGADQPVTPHDQRMRQLLAHDAVHRQSLVVVLRQALHLTAERLGRQRYELLLQEVDVETRQQVAQYVRL